MRQRANRRHRAPGPSSDERGLVSENPYTRRIDPIEHWFLAFPKKMSAVENLCVEGIGRLDADELRRAVAVASAACPGARLVRRGRTWVDGGVDPEVRVVRGRTADPGAAPELRAPLPTRTGATCEVVLFDGPSPTVVFRAGHVVMDVRGLAMWARDVFRVLRGERPSGAASAATVLDLDDPFYELAGTSEPSVKVPSLLGVPPGADLARQVWRRRTVERDVPDLSARLAAALVEASGQEVAPMGFMVDLRTFHPEVASTGNLSLAISMDLRAGDSWHEVDRRLRAALTERDCRVDAPDAEILKAPRPILRHVVRRADGNARRDDRLSLVAEVYDLGAMPPEWFSTAGFTAAGAYVLCPMEPGAAVTVITTQRPGRTDLTAAWWDGPGMAERVDALLDRLCAALPAGPAEAGRAGVSPGSPSAGGS
jgi:hypothetical protein